MEGIVWDESWNIGVEIVDKAHAKLFRIIQKLVELSEDVSINQHTYKEGIKYLENYSMTHFSEEEAYMRSIRYKGYAEHKRVHDNFRDKTLVAMKKDLESTGYSMMAVQRFLGIMSRWLKEHILQEDQAIVGRGARKGQDLSSQIPVISRVVNRTTQELFLTEARLVSEAYKGQNIGQGFYCHRCYDTENSARVQILIGMEESLMFRGINRQTGGQPESRKDMSDEEALQIFDLLFQRVSRLFRVETECEFDKENLLTKDGFRANFMKGYPCSLLFNCKLGYLIFCYRSWRIKKSS